MGKFKDFFAAVNYTNPQIMLTISFYCKLILCITIKFMKNNNQWEVFVCIWAELFEAGLFITTPGEVSWQPIDILITQT